MSDKSRLFKFLLITVVFHLSLFLYKNYLVKDIDPGNLQQEEFLSYVDSMGSGKFPNNLTLWNKRYFPGLPIMIFAANLPLDNPVLAGLTVGVLGLILFFLLAYKLTNNHLFSFTLTIFPPIVYELTSKISTEAVLIPFILLSYLLAFENRNYRFSSLVSGFGVWIRPVAFASFASLLIHILINEKEKTKKLAAAYPFILGIFLLGVFNYLFFNGNPLHQLDVYRTMTNLTSSFSGLIMDVKIEIGQSHWRILASSFSYLILSALLLIYTLKRRGSFLFKNDAAYIKSWAVIVFLFIFSYGPSQFLGDTRRFLSVFFPLILLANYKSLGNKRIYYFLSFFAAAGAFI